MDVEAQLQLIEVILLITFFGIGFFCSLSETALFTLKGPILRKMQKSYPKKTKIISTFLEHPRETLTALTLLNTTANFGVAFLALWMTLKREFAQFPFIIISLLILIILQVQNQSIHFQRNETPRSLGIKSRSGFTNS